VCAPEHSPDVDVVACQHIIMRDTQHLLRPWHDDAMAMDTEAQAVTSSPAQLLHETSHGTVSGLCFIDAVEQKDTVLPVCAWTGGFLTVLSALQIAARMLFIAQALME
jgi:hypothetical protein